MGKIGGQLVPPPIAQTNNQQVFQMKIGEIGGGVNSSNLSATGLKNVWENSSTADNHQFTNSTPSSPYQAKDLTIGGHHQLDHQSPIYPGGFQRGARVALVDNPHRIGQVGRFDENWGIEVIFADEVDWYLPSQLSEIDGDGS
ncbi:MAG: hypothetical protein ACRDEA_04345, partial [Microcystaceae cyanobacterium]